MRVMFFIPGVPKARVESWGSEVPRIDESVLFEDAKPGPSHFRVVWVRWPVDAHGWTHSVEIGLEPF